MFTLPTLSYDYGALAPVIDELTMKLHHGKHHQAYLDKLNAALESSPDLSAKPLEELLSHLESVLTEIRSAVKNHGGGHYNHSLFWTMLAPAGSADTVLPPALEAYLVKNFGSLADFKKEFETAGISRFGSGWVWLVQNEAGQAQIISTANQDTPLELGLTPLLAVDVWEHAYYLNYQNRRADYLSKIWEIINWQTVAKLAKL